MLEKLTLEDIKPSTRKYPSINFKYSKIPGKDVLHIQGLNKSLNDELLIKNFSLDVVQGEKIAFIAQNPIIITTLFQMLNGELEPDSGEINWGVTATRSYFPKFRPYQMVRTIFSRTAYKFFERLFGQNVVFR